LHEEKIIKLEGLMGAWLLFSNIRVLFSNLVSGFSFSAIYFLVLSRSYACSIVVICPGFDSNYFLKYDKIEIFGHKEAPKPLYCSLSPAISAKRSSTLPIMEGIYQNTTCRLFQKTRD
jgi:hypothetical protein